MLPAIVVVGVLYLVGSRGLSDPLTALAAAVATAIALIATLRVAPIFVAWLVPASMCAFLPLPIQHYEALVLLLAGLMILKARSTTGLRAMEWSTIEWAYAAFLATTLLGVLFGLNVWRAMATLKVYVIGFVGFEVARRAARDLGRKALLWGPVLFMIITAAMLGVRVLQLGVPGFKSVLLRTYVTHLPWGTSNFVAAVQVLCMPALALLIRLTSARSAGRWFAVLAMVGTLGSMLITSSRGGFVLSTIYLATLSYRLRRSLPLALLVGGAFVVGVVATPFGQAMLTRFTNNQNLDSIVFRARIWQAAWERGATHLPFGVGIGQGVLQADRLQIMDPHDFLLTLFSENGPLTVVAWLVVLITLWRRAGRLGDSPDDSAASRALRATLMLSFFNCLFEPTFSSNLYFLLFWWILGIIEAMKGAVRRAAKTAQPATT
ncbi:MAG TPA: O-antigen ligase family protein [Candidatus Saccharimonadaceae bacterium]|nr:O-antigen ligase family protein [Candidatus Saccharimonadaceae bacterium]